MFFTLLAAMTSATVLAGALLAAHNDHASSGGYLAGIIVGILLATLNFWIVHSGALLLARRANSKSQSFQNLVGKTLFLGFFPWAALAEFASYKATLIVLPFMH